MKFLIAWLIGERIGRGAYVLNRQADNGLWGIFWWFVIGLVANYGVYSNFGPGYAGVGEAGILFAVFLFCSFRPINTTFKMMMLSGVDIAAKIVGSISTGYILIWFGWGLLSGGVKKSGIASLPLPSLGYAAALALIAVFVIWLIRAIISIDARRYQTRPGGAARNDPPDGYDDDSGSDGPSDDRPGGGGQYGANAQSASSDTTPHENWWDVLGVERTCSRKEAESGGRKELLKYHPDTVAARQPHFKKAAEAQTRAILRALKEARAEKPA